LTGEPWHFHTAKARFSELFRQARIKGPQLILSDKKEGVAMLTIEQFDLLAARPPQAKSLYQFLRESPLVGLDLDPEINKDY